MSANPPSFSSLTPDSTTFYFFSFLEEEGLDAVAAVSKRCLSCIRSFRFDDFNWRCKTIELFGDKLALETKKHHTVWIEVYSILTAVYSKNCMSAAGLPATMKIPSMPRQDINLRFENQPPRGPSHKFLTLGPRQSSGIEIVGKEGSIEAIHRPSATNQSLALSRRPKWREFMERTTSVPSPMCNQNVASFPPPNAAPNRKPLYCEDPPQTDEQPPRDYNLSTDQSDGGFKSDDSAISVRNRPIKVGSTEEEMPSGNEVSDLSNSLHKQHIDKDDSVQLELKRSTSRERTPTHRKFRNPNTILHPRKKK